MSWGYAIYKADMGGAETLLAYTDKPEDIGKIIDHDRKTYGDHCGWYRAVWIRKGEVQAYDRSNVVRG